MRQIIYAWNYREWGGAQIYFMALMKRARERYPVLALLPEDSDKKLLDYLDAIGVPVEFLPPAPRRDAGHGFLAKARWKFDHYRYGEKLVRQILHRPGVRETLVHADLGFWQSYSALATLARSVDVFATIHTGLPQFTGLRGLRWRSKGKMISRVDRFHLHASNVDARRSLAPYITPEKYRTVEVLYSGFDPDEIEQVVSSGPSKEAVRKRYDIPANANLLMNVGQFIDRKGCWVLLETLKRLADRDLRFLWITTSRPTEEVMYRVESFGLGDRFRILSANEVGPGRIDLLGMLRAADIFVLPSLQEGLPIALIEAMALGLPCIASGVNAIPEAIDDGVSGLLVPPSDISALRSAIVRLADSRDLRLELGAAAKAAAYAKFNEHHIADRMLELYEAAWQRRG